MSSVCPNSLKRCTRCLVDKSTSAFTRRAASNDGLRPACRKCEKSTKAARYLRDREKIRARQRERNALNPEPNRRRVAKWQQENPERYRAGIREYQAKNRERIRQRHAEYYAQNRDVGIRKRTEYRERNRDQLNASARERYASDAARRANVRALGSRRRARQRGLPNEPIDATRVFERDGWRCGICSKKVNKRLRWPDPLSASIDHIIPISQDGPHLYVNVQCAHLTCNLKKNDRGSGEQLLLIG